MKVIPSRAYDKGYKKNIVPGRGSYWDPVADR